MLLNINDAFLAFRNECQLNSLIMQWLSTRIRKVTHRRFRFNPFHGVTDRSYRVVTVAGGQFWTNP